MKLTAEQLAYLDSLPKSDQAEYLQLKADEERCRQEWREQFAQMGATSRGIDFFKEDENADGRI